MCTYLSKKKQLLLILSNLHMALKVIHITKVCGFLVMQAEPVLFVSIGVHWEQINLLYNSISHYWRTGESFSCEKAGYMIFQKNHNFGAGLSCQLQLYPGMGNLCPSFASKKV